MEPGGSLRERHASRTRRRIVAEAWELFAEQGYAATTADEIAARSDVSPRTFFRYFATKDALLFFDFDERLARITERIEARPRHEPPAETFVHVLGEVVADFERAPAERALVERLVAERPSIRSYQRSTIAEHGEREVTQALARRAGVPADDLALRTMVAAVGACFDVALRDWFARGARAGGEGFPEFFAGVIEGCAAAFPGRIRSPRARSRD